MDNRTAEKIQAEIIKKQEQIINEFKEIRKSTDIVIETYKKLFEAACKMIVNIFCGGNCPASIFEDKLDDTWERYCMKNCDEFTDKQHKCWEKYFKEEINDEK